MDLTLTYDKLFRIVNCDSVIFFEDDFSFNDKKESLLYGFSRMDVKQRKNLLAITSEINEEFTTKLHAYSQLFNHCSLYINWKEKVIFDDISTAFHHISTIDECKEYSDELKKLYDEIEIPNDQKLLQILHYYGLGVAVPDYFNRIFEEYIFKNSTWKNFKVYEDFSASISDLFKQDLEKNKLSGKTLICIIDNQLSSGEQRANEVLSFINDFNKKTRNNIIGAVLSSKERKEEFTVQFFAEFVDKKDNQNLQTNLQNALVKSTYSLILDRLKKIYLSTLEKSFDEAISNKDIAAYLSKMASYEGITNYKVITDWIQLLFGYKINGNKEIIDIVKLTQLIDILEDEDTEFSQDMLKLNTFEAFDYNVNTYFQPPAAGDIFVDEKGLYYILVGQDCDIITSQTRSGNNAVTEFVKAEIVPQDTIDKVSYNLEYMCVDNFRQMESDIANRLQIKYSSRIFIDNAIVKMACYNNLGKCQLNLFDDINEETEDFLAPYLIEAHKELQKYFRSIKVLNENSSVEISTILNSSYSPRFIPLNKYEIDDDGKTMKFKFQRVCRMNRTYVLYLYKLFLEYRGRHPFDCINLSRHSSLEACVVGAEHIHLPFDVILSSNRKTNRNAIKKLNWLVKPEELENVIKEAYKRVVKLKEKELVIIDKNPYSVSCEDNSQIVLVKKDHNMISISLS
ncbi:hypothetical protein [Lacrimispora sp.]|uniref:hypothetical protein n=1 Tax=Lacrimispora sp. TaxID=2719234 RepID=UPI0029E1AE2B|nr:hypothetical protein [Lacrimispora sp.]